MAKKVNAKPQPKKKPTPKPPPLPVVVDPDDDDDDEKPLDQGDDDDAEADHADIVRAANELSGADSGAKVHVYKLLPKEQKGTCLPYAAGDFSLERLMDDYGGGTYQITIRHAHGPIFKRSTETLVERREKPGAPAIDVSLIKREAKAEYEAANAPVMALMSKAFDAMIGRGPIAGVDPAASMNQMLEGAERIAKIGNKSREGTSELEHLAHLVKFVDSIRGGSAEKPDNTGIGLVRDLIGMVRDAKPARLVAPGGDTANGEGEGMNVFIRELFASYGGVFLRAAEAGSDAQVYAQLLCDQVPPKFYPVVAAQLKRPDWFEQLAALDPRVAPHRAWIEELRTAFLTAVDAVLKPEAIPASQPST